MSFEVALEEELSSIPGLEDKVFPVAAPELTPSPYLVYVGSEGVATKTLKRFLSSKRLQIEIDITAQDYPQLKTLASEVIQRLQSFVGRTVGILEPEYVEDLTYGDPIESFEPELKLYQAAIDFNVYLKGVNN